MSKHTPGPWKAKNLGPPMSDPTMLSIWWIREGAVSLGTDNPADAYLCAAAPEMLEALKSIENDDGSIPEAIWNLRCQAIAKAEGGGSA